MTKSNHKADMKNPNKGTSGQNKTHAANQGNRGGQLQKAAAAKPAKKS